MDNNLFERPVSRFTAGVPLYIQIAESLLDRIESGELSPGDRLPSERELSQEMDVSRMTLRRALDLLETQGLILRRRGDGTYVAAPKTEQRPRPAKFAYHHPYRGPIKLVVLDWAGTTLDYGCYAPAVVFIEVFKRRGVEISMEQARRPMGLHKREHIRAIGQYEDVAVLWEAAHGRPMNEQDVEEMFADFQPLQMQCLADYADLIPGTLEAVAALQARGVLIGSSTGYFSEAMELLKREAAMRGYTPDSSVCADQVPAGRPHPWMVFQNMFNTGVYPPEAVVKVDDTRPGIGEGLNAAAWTIGLAKTGNEIGLNLAEIEALDPQTLEQKLASAREGLARSGAHYVVDSIGDIPAVIDDIDARLARGERP